MVHHSPGAHSLPGAERCRSTLRHGSARSNQGPVPLVLPSLSSTAPPSTGMQGAHARPIVAQLTPGDPRPIAAAQNVPAERSGLESREGQPPPSRQPDVLPPPPLEWRSQAPRPSLRVGNWVWRALCDDGWGSPHRLDGARLRYWAARAIARSWRHFESHYWTKLDKLRARRAAVFDEASFPPPRAFQRRVDRPLGPRGRRSAGFTPRPIPPRP